MAFTHGKNTKVYVNGYDLTSYFKQSSQEATREVGETTTYGKNDKTYLAGLRDATLSLGGLFEGSLDAADQVLNAALTSEGSIFTILPEGDVNGKRGYGYAAEVTDYSIDSPLDDIVGDSVEAQSKVGREHLLVHHALATESASGNGAAQDGGAASSNGGVGYLHVPDITGIINLAVVIEDSADGVAGWATILTFAGVTADRAKERVAITGTVRRHTRATWTFTGVGTAQFFVGFGRK